MPYGCVGYGHNGSLLGLEANAVFFPDGEHLFVVYKNLGGGSDKSFLDPFMR